MKSINKKAIAVLVICAMLTAAGCSKKASDKNEESARDTKVEREETQENEETSVNADKDDEDKDDESAESTADETVEMTTETTTETTVLEDDNKGLCSEYQSVIDDIVSHLDDQAAMFDGHMGIAEMMSFSSASEVVDNIGVGLYDVDGDGVEELFILDLTVGDSNSHNVLEIYTLDAIGNLYEITKAGCARNCFYLYDDGIILNVGSAGWAYTIVMYNHIENGQLVPYECYWSDTECYGDAPSGLDMYWYTSTNREDILNSEGNGTFFSGNDVYGTMDPSNGHIDFDTDTLSDYM